MSRPRCSVFIATSLDGFIAGKNGELGWLEAVHSSETDYGYAEFLRSVDALVLGRATYDQVRGAEQWPYAGKRCVVMTHRALAPVAGEEAFSGAPVDLVDRLGRAGVHAVYVDGGNVIRQFLAAGLVGEMVISVIPVLLGEGVPLFGPGTAPANLRLTGAESFPSGLAQLKYEVGARAR